jgi:histidinol dehydrogenase
MRILSGRAAVARVRKLADRGAQFGSVEPQVKRIVSDVRRNGDSALRKYAQRWDGLAKDASILVEEEAMRDSWKASSSQFRSALQLAAKNIRQFCEWQKPKEWTRNRNGISLGQLVRPLESVGCYVPGGRYPLVSTLLMTVIPAQVAGVKNIRVVSPQPRPEVLAAAGMLGIKEFYRVGGAQAIAALAYGTKTIPRVDKIVGPGNLYVTAAKKLVSFGCAIDFLAGPTEVVILSDDGKSEFIAADLVAQAEHDPEALAVFITTSSRLAKSVSAAVVSQSRQNSLAKESLQRHGNPQCGLGICWRLLATSSGRLRLWPKSRAANGGRSALSGRLECDGLCETYHRARAFLERAQPDCSGDRVLGGDRGFDRAR